MGKALNKVLVLIIIFSSFACNRAKEVVVETYPDGSKKVVQYFLKNSENPYKEISFYEDGKKMMEGTFEENRRHGTWYYWYPNGQLWTEGNYNMDVEHGYKVIFHENGQKHYEGQFKDGQRSGMWKFYNSTGELAKEIEYN